MINKDKITKEEREDCEFLYNEMAKLTLRAYSKLMPPDEEKKFPAVASSMKATLGQFMRELDDYLGLNHFGTFIETTKKEG